MIFPISRSKYKIMKHIYENPGSGIAEILKETRTSVSSGYRYIEELLNSGIVSERLVGGKPTLRELRPNFHESGAAIFMLLEIEKKLDFFSKHKKLIGPVTQFDAESRCLVDSAVIFGSFARGSETDESDLDILVIGSKIRKRKLDAIQERSFVTLKNRLSLRLMDMNDFIKILKEGNEFARQITKEHIVIVNPTAWIKLISECLS